MECRPCRHNESHIVSFYFGTNTFLYICHGRSFWRKPSIDYIDIYILYRIYLVASVCVFSATVCFTETTGKVTKCVKIMTTRKCWGFPSNRTCIRHLAPKKRKLDIPQHEKGDDIRLMPFVVPTDLGGCAERIAISPFVQYKPDVITFLVLLCRVSSSSVQRWRMKTQVRFEGNPQHRFLVVTYFDTFW